MNAADIFILLFVFFIIKLFFDMLIPNKKKKRSYRKTTTETTTENQKLLILGSIFLVGISIYIINILIDTVKFISTNITEILIITTIIGFFIFAINFLIKIFFPNIFKKQTINSNNDFQHYEYQNNHNKTYETPNTKKSHSVDESESIKNENLETKKLEAMLKNINIQNQSKPQQNMYDTIKKESYQLGKEYELQIGNKYEKLGYSVDYHGIRKKEKDNGIDLIVTSNNETIFIQCKNNQKSIIKQIKLKEFIGNCTEFIEKNPDKYKNIKRLFIVAKDKKDYGTKKYLENNKSVEYKVIPYINL